MSSYLFSKTAIITGATSGIGACTARNLASRGAFVVVVGRDVQRGQDLCSSLENSGLKAVFEPIDLTDPRQIREGLSRILSRTPTIDLLINSAGALFAHREETADGLERTFALNHMGYFRMTMGLLEHFSPTARVINVSSEAHRKATLHFDDLQHRRRWPVGGMAVYCASKLANILFTRELHRRYQHRGLRVAAVNPGFVNTGFARNNGWFAQMVMSLSRPLQRSVAGGSDTVVWAATSPEISKNSGLYWSCRKAVMPSEAARDEALAMRLWAISEDLS